MQHWLAQLWAVNLDLWMGAVPESLDHNDIDRRQTR